MTLNPQVSNANNVMSIPANFLAHGTKGSAELVAMDTSV